MQHLQMLEGNGAAIFARCSMMVTFNLYISCIQWVITNVSASHHIISCIGTAAPSQFCLACSESEPFTKIF
jgi:hypothetical protein